MKKLLAYILGLLMAVSLVSCTATPSESAQSGTTTKSQTTKSETTKSQTTTTKKKAAYGKGETAEIDKIKVTLVNVTENNGGEYLKPKSGNVFLVYEFLIENGTDDELAVSSMMSFDAYVDDTTTSISISAMTSVTGKSQLDGSVAPGKKMSGVVGYEVPSTWKTSEVYFKPNVLKNDKLVFQYNK